MDITMKKALRGLVISAVMLLLAGSALYHLGSQINVDVQMRIRHCGSKLPAISGSSSEGL